MVSIDTESVREMAELLDREANRYNNRISVLEDCSSWLKRQEFGEKQELYRVLRYQYEELQQQRHKLRLLAEAARRACDRYDSTEQKIAESETVHPKQIGRISTISLKQVQKYLAELGIHITDL